MSGAKRPKSDQVARTDNGNPVLRSNLFVFPFFGHGELVIIVDRETGTILCQKAKETWGTLSYPIPFTPRNAHKWITEGTLGELQESLSNLSVGFTSTLVKPPRWKTDSSPS